MLKQRLNKFIRNPKKALFTLALPTIIGMVVQTLYNVVDTAFVGRLGVDAIAALTFSFPVFFLYFAILHVVSIGTSAKISQFVGAKNKTAAENVGLHGLLISLALALITSILGFIFLKPLFTIIGAQGVVLQMSLDYMYFILIGVFFMFPAFVFHSIFISQGDTKTPMKLQISALLLNIILDYIFIYPLGMGVKGAALATLISFIFNLSLSIYFVIKKSKLHIHPKNFHASFWITKKIFFIGAPAGLMMMLTSVYITILNHIMSHFSNAHVAVIGIIFRMENVAFMPVVGASVALLTLVGMFYGAKRYDLVKKIVFYAIKVGVLFTLIGTAIFFLFPGIFVRIFTTDANLIQLSSNFLRINVFILPLLAVIVLINRTMQGLGTGLPGLVSNITRVIIVSVPLSYLAVFVFNLDYLAVAVIDVIGAFLAAAVVSIWLIIKLKKLHLLDSDSL